MTRLRVTGFPKLRLGPAVTKGSQLLGRRDVLAVLSLVLPEFLWYVQVPASFISFYPSILICQGFFYSLWWPGGPTTNFRKVQVLSRAWLTPAPWGSPMALVLYWASFGLAVFGLLIRRRWTRPGAFLMLGAGVMALGWLFAMFTHPGILFDPPTPAPPTYIRPIWMPPPIPIGAMILVVLGLIDLNLDSHLKLTPRTSLVVGRLLVGYYLFNFIFFIFFGGFATFKIVFIVINVLDVPVISVTVLLVVVQRYLSDQKLENAQLQQRSDRVFHGAIASLVGAYFILLFATTNLWGSFLFRLGVMLGCAYVTLPGIADLPGKNLEANIK